MYEKLDALLLKEIAALNGPHALSVTNEVYRLGKSTGREQHRILDGRLQALRKAGKIRYADGKWWVVTK